MRPTFAAPAGRPGSPLIRSLGMSAVALGAIVERGGGAPGTGGAAGTWSGSGLGWGLGLNGVGVGVGHGIGGWGWVGGRDRVRGV